MILVVGAKGNMGQRYCSILKYLDVPFIGVDKGDYVNRVKRNGLMGVIIATPTSTHISEIRKYKNLPILCEKPITTNVHDFIELKEMNCVRLNMVEQYRYLIDAGRFGMTVYDYFKHGNDGIYWDCLQPIMLAKNDIVLGEQSPIWKCSINGQDLDIAEMDGAYIANVKAWLNGDSNLSDIDMIWAAHRKVDEFRKTGSKTWRN